MKTVCYIVMLFKVTIKYCHLVNTRLTDKVWCSGAGVVPPVGTATNVSENTAVFLVINRVVCSPLRVGLIEDTARASPREVMEWIATLRSRSQPVVLTRLEICGEKILYIRSVKIVAPIKFSITIVFDIFQRNTEFGSPYTNYLIWLKQLYLLFEHINCKYLLFIIFFTFSHSASLGVSTIVMLSCRHVSRASYHVAWEINISIWQFWTRGSTYLIVAE